MIIVVVSLARAGKDTFADYLVKNYNYKKINTSDILVKSLIDMGKEPTKINQSWLGDVWRKESGRMDIVTLRAIENIQGNNIVITGIRSQEEVDLVKQKFPDMITISIVADKLIRYSRRTKSDAQKLEDFLARDTRDIENKGLAKVLCKSDYFLCNNSSLEGFYSDIDRLLRRLENEV
ncbi:hypothetical protein D6777_04015 [Candidatus Woesearchaeota archaeon]|nr:MAG: hypothetical protein D6777_04015 [Candidatus Woesearchaeota archaeon]